MYIIIKRHDGSQVMSLKNWLKTDLLKKSQEMVNRTLKFQNFRGISVSYVVWSIEMSLTEIQWRIQNVQKGDPDSI
jgi:hypothetical protein